MRTFDRFAIKAFIALLLAGAFVILAGFETRTAFARQSTDCLACHPRSFAGEVHGQGINNQGFKDVWNAQGKPKTCLQCHVTNYDPATDTWLADSITCVACHSPIPEDHPNQDIPVDKSTDLCAKCHNDSRFGWNDWKVSTHYQRSMTCSECHDPHIPRRTTEVAAQVCEKCHEDMSQRAEHSTHAKAGVTCISCHLGTKKGNDEFHKVFDHGFKPELETCNGCHAQEMHDEVIVTVTPTATPVPTAIFIESTPAPAALPTAANGPSLLTTLSNKLQFESHYFVVLVGIIGGLILSPMAGSIVRGLRKGRKK
jgi:hypothetical protein